MKRRTKKAYETLYDDPESLFEGCKVLLFPNGENAIWITGKDGSGIKITASAGKAGLGLRVCPSLGTPSITINGNREGDYEPLRVADDAREVSLTQYKPDAKSQAFKRWYQSTPEERKRDGLTPDGPADTVSTDTPKPECGGVVE